MSDHTQPDRGGEDLVRVYSTESESDAYLAKGRLEAEGIPAMLKDEIGGPYPVGAIFLMVPGAFEEQALAIMASISELAPTTDADEEEAEAGADSPDAS